MAPVNPHLHSIPKTEAAFKEGDQVMATVEGSIVRFFLNGSRVKKIDLDTSFLLTRACRCCKTLNSTCLRSNVLGTSSGVPMERTRQRRSFPITKSKLVLCLRQEDLKNADDLSNIFCRREGKCGDFGRLAKINSKENDFLRRIFLAHFHPIEERTDMWGSGSGGGRGLVSRLGSSLGSPRGQASWRMWVIPFVLVLATTILCTYLYVYDTSIIFF